MVEKDSAKPSINTSGAGDMSGLNEPVKLILDEGFHFPNAFDSEKRIDTVLVDAISTISNEDMAKVTTVEELLSLFDRIGTLSVENDNVDTDTVPSISYQHMRSKIDSLATQARLAKRKGQLGQFRKGMLAVIDHTNPLSIRPIVSKNLAEMIVDFVEAEK